MQQKYYIVHSTYSTYTYKYFFLVMFDSYKNNLRGCHHVYLVPFLIKYDINYWNIPFKLHLIMIHPGDGTFERSMYYM